jgi:hypothetical protein
MSFKVTGKAVIAGAIAVSNSIPELRKIVEVGVDCHKQAFNVDDTVCHTTC